MEENQEKQLPVDTRVFVFPSNMPRIVCLCGSTRFYDEFQKAYFEETMKRRIVLSVGFKPGVQEHGQTVGITPEQKEMLDELHMRRIDLADEVYILNKGGYVGESTRKELEYARSKGKPIRYLEYDDDYFIEPIAFDDNEEDGG